MKNVIILGSTGSIGTQALEVIDKLDNFKVLALSCGKNTELLKKQIKKFNPEIVCVQDSESVKEIKEEFKNIEVLFGQQGLIELSENKKCDVFIYLK